MNIIFKKLEIQNFLSIGNVELDFVAQNNVVFITGYNYDENSKNGAGKSSILEALHFAIIGDTFRSIKRQNLINKNSSDKSFVRLEFSVENDQYEILREIKPSKVVFKVNGVDKSRTVTETNSDIIKIINIDKTIFQNTLIISNDTAVPFLDRPISEKTKFVESILSLSSFDKLFEIAKNGLLQIKKNKDIAEAKKTMVANDLIRFKAFSLNFEKERDKAIDEYDQLRVRLKNQIDAIDIEDLDMEKYRDKEEKNRNNLQIGERKLFEVQTKQKSLEKEISHLKSNTACPTCKREYEDKQTKLDKIDELSKSVKEYNDQILEINGKLKILKDRKIELEKYKKKIDENNQKRTLVGALHDQLDSVDEKIKNEQIRENSYKKLVDEKEIEANELSSEFDVLNREYSVYDKLKFIYSPDGVKPAIIKKIINLFNNLLKNYLIQLNAPCSIIFDEMFEDKVLDKNKNEITYYSLSSGERKRVDLALLFAFRELRRFQSNVSCNVTFFDEVFDSSLDDTGMQCCLKIIEELSSKYNEKYFIITHRAEQIDTNKFDVLKIEKRNGISSLSL